MADSPLHDHPKSRKDARDFTDSHNTKLSDEDEKAYQAWAKDNNREGDTYDYDMRGAWKEGASQSDNGHFPDTYKKPNHPTFSNESKYHGKEDAEGGTWSKKDGRDTFAPGKTNKKHWKSDELKDYFQKVEPDADLLTEE